MIVRQTGNSLLLIRQPDHAHLAGALMHRVRALADHPRRGPILHAIAEHDNGWTEEDRAPMLAPDGGIVEFVSAPVAVKQRVWPRGVARLARDPWAAALVAEHALCIYDRFRDAPEWSDFFDTITGLRERFRSRTGHSTDDLRADYTFVRLGDLISLVFCTEWTDVQRVGDWTVRLADRRVVVSPDPFDGAVIPVSIRARSLPNRRYESAGALHEAWAAAPYTAVSGEVHGG